jgi:hypothetical protein
MKIEFNKEYLQNPENKSVCVDVAKALRIITGHNISTPILMLENDNGETVI